MPSATGSVAFLIYSLVFVLVCCCWAPQCPWVPQRLTEWYLTNSHRLLSLRAQKNPKQYFELHDSEMGSRGRHAHRILCSWPPRQGLCPNRIKASFRVIRLTTYVSGAKMWEHVTTLF